MKKLLQLKTWPFCKTSRDSLQKQQRRVNSSDLGPSRRSFSNLVMKFPSHKCLESNIDETSRAGTSPTEKLETSQTFTNIAIILHSDSPFAISFWSIWRIQLFQAVLAASTALLEKTGGLSTPASGYQAIWVDFFWRLNLDDKNPQNWSDLSRKTKSEGQFDSWDDYLMILWQCTLMQSHGAFSVVNFWYLILLDMGKMQHKSQLLGSLLAILDDHLYQMMLSYISILSILLAVDFEQLHLDLSELRFQNRKSLQSALFPKISKYWGAASAWIRRPQLAHRAQRSCSRGSCPCYRCYCRGPWELSEGL